MARQTSLVKCAYCGIEFEKENRRIKQTEKAGKKHTCGRPCASMITNEGRKAPPSSKMAEHARRSKEKFPLENKARQLVRQALKTGKLIRPEACEECGEMFNSLGEPLVIEGHHEDHSCPYLLYWLCEKCHKFHDKHKFAGFGTDYSEQINGKT